jgi:uncharacterized protein YciI
MEIPIVGAPQGVAGGIVSRFMQSVGPQGIPTRADLLMVGTFGDPQKEGSMSIFTRREAAEEFAKEDPFVLNNIVRAWHIREWNEVLVP